jgi:hypothetical protein
MKAWILIGIIAMLSLTSCTYTRTGCFEEKAELACSSENKSVSYVWEGGLSGGPYFTCVDAQGLSGNEQRLFSLEQKKECSIHK